MERSTPANVICPPCGNEGGLLEPCVSQGDYGVPVCQDGLTCRKYMGKDNVCVPSNYGTEGNYCVPGYGDLLTCYDDELKCIDGICSKVHKKKVNGWVIGSIICIIILLVLLLVLGLKK